MNTNLKRAIVGLALLFSMGMANATTYNMGTLTTSGYSNSPAATTGPKSISDIYTFFLSSSSEVIASVFDLSKHPFKITNLDKIKNLDLTFMGSPSSPPFHTAFDQFLSSGSYSFTVTGGVKKNKVGQYLFSATLGSPIPEPSTWAMMLGGLGLIGFMSFRRRKYS